MRGQLFGYLACSHVDVEVSYGFIVGFLKVGGPSGIDIVKYFIW